MKKTLLAVALTAASVSAVADTKLSGHVNYVGGFLEDLNGNEGLTVATADASESRFRIISTIKAAGIEYGLREEFGLGEPGRNGDSGFNRRFNEIWIKGSAGKLSLGQGSLAGDGVTEEDFSGTYVLSGELSSFQLEAPSATDGGDQEGDFSDAGSRDINRGERLRYDAPAIGHLALSASINDATSDDEGNDVGFAARYKLKAFAVHAAYIAAEEDDSDIFAASIAGKAFGGFTASLRYFIEENGSDSDADLEQVGVVLGYNPGPYSISVDYQVTENDLDGASEVDIDTFGLNFVYRPTKGVELYAGLRTFDNDASGDDGDAFLFGGRIKF